MENTGSPHVSFIGSNHIHLLTDTSKIPSKEHAIDSSITSETGINTAKQNFSSQVINVHELPPKAHVQAITNDTYMHGVQRSQGFDSIEELKQGQSSELRYQCSESRFPEGKVFFF